jgi:hypothetical protein
VDRSVFSEDAVEQGVLSAAFDDTAQRWQVSVLLARGTLAQNNTSAGLFQGSLFNVGPSPP